VTVIKRPGLPPRALQLSEFSDHLRTINSREGRPYEESTISTYMYPAKALDAWMTASGIEGDFTAVDTAVLNRYFRDYYGKRGQAALKYRSARLQWIGSNGPFQYITAALARRQ
jgi:hypothetical protein